MPLPQDLNFEVLERKWAWEKDGRDAKDMKELLHKWNVLPDLVVKSFKASKRFQQKDEETIIQQMFNKNTIQSSLFGIPANDTTEIHTKIHPLSCSVLSMSFFDKLVDLQILSDTETAYIRGCYEEEVDGILVQDKLRLMCAKDNMGEYAMPQGDRGEFIFHLLKLVCIGGAKCQCEDRFHSLKNVIKTMYKEFVQVRKDSNEKIEICSHIYEIEFDEMSSEHIFSTTPRNVHNKCYAVISNNQSVTILVKKYMPFW